MDIQSIVERKLSAIDIAEKEFKNAIAGLDSRLQDIIMNWLNGLQIVNGKIDPETSRVFLNKLNGLLATTINKRNLAGPVKGLLKHFDTVENYTKKTLELENTIDLSKFDLSEEKKQAINEITDALLNDDVLKSNVINPLKKIAFRHVVTGISFQDAQKEFEKALSGNPITRYSRQITSEAIHRYDGMINQRVATEYKLDAFRIVGSLISTSQAVCINMIKESGPFQGMAINGKYPMKELPAILRIVNSYKGAVPGTNESNYFINRNHWGCRHTFIPTRFTRKDLEGMPEGVVNTAAVPFVPPALSKFLEDKGVDFDKSIFNHLNKDFSIDLIEGVRASVTLDGAKMTLPTERSTEATKMVFLHEYGHMVDIQTDLRKHPTFKKFFRKWSKHYQPEYLTKIDEKLWSLGEKAYLKGEPKFFEMKQIGVVHDTMKALYKYWGSGHSDAYFRLPERREMEVIAHMFSVKYQGNKYFKRYMPELYQAMLDFEIPEKSIGP